MDPRLRSSSLFQPAICQGWKGLPSPRSLQHGFERPSFPQIVTLRMQSREQSRDRAPARSAPCPPGPPPGCGSDLGTGTVCRAWCWPQPAPELGTPGRCPGQPGSPFPVSSAQNPLFSRVSGFVWGVTWRCPPCTGHGELRFSFQWDRCLWSPARGSFSLWEVSEWVGRHEPQPQPSCQATGWDRAQTPRACVGSSRLPSHRWGVLGALLSPIHSFGGTTRPGERGAMGQRDPQLSIRKASLSPCTLGVTEGPPFRPVAPSCRCLESVLLLHGAPGLFMLRAGWGC